MQNKEQDGEWSGRRRCSGAYVIRTTALKAIGLGLSAAILLEATLVRMVMVPAFLKLSGDWNWWLPGRLDRILPHVELEKRERRAVGD